MKRDSHGRPIGPHPLGIKIARLQEELMLAGFYQTGRAMHEASRVFGEEAAEQALDRRQGARRAFPAPTQEPH